MTASVKNSEKLIGWDPKRSPTSAAAAVNHHNVRSCTSKLIIWLIVFVSVTYVVYTLKLVSYPTSCADNGGSTDPFLSAGDPRILSAITTQLATSHLHSANKSAVENDSSPTNISHIVFGIGASSKLWKKRKEYIKIWYKPESGMRGVVWLDSEVKLSPNDVIGLPPVRISGDTAQFPYRNRQGHRSAIRISRIVSETLRLGLKDVRWFVLGDDDTVFITENLVRVLEKYDHTQYYYIGSSSESHVQNIHFSYAMAYGGGGFAISYPLAVALAKMQDRCIKRYPGLYGSDDRIQACMAELGVPLTKHLGFHQYDVYGNLFGLLAAHPVTPLISLHHLDVVEPIFPDVSRVQALQRLQAPMRLDSAGLMQQSVCYDRSRMWTVSVSWGFAVQVIRGVISPREMEMPTRTFLNWYKRADYTAYAFNTRPVFRNPCQKPVVFYMERAGASSATNKTVTEYARLQSPALECRWKIKDPSALQTITVYKKADPQLWNRSPRRNCCRVLSSKSKEKMVLEVGVCREGEVVEV